VNLNGQPIAPVHAHPKYPTTVCLSPDGKTYLLGFQDGLLEHWDLLGSHERYAIRTRGWMNSIAFSPDSRTYLAGNREGFLWHRETDTGRQIGEPLRTSSPIWSFAFTPDGQRFFVGTDDETQLWDLGTHEMLQKSPTQGLVSQILIHADGKRALLVVGGFAREWNFATDGAVHSPGFQPEGGIAHLALSPDGQRVLISGADRVARLWDVSTGKQLGPSLGTRVRPVEFTRDNSLMAVGDTDGRIVIWEPSGSIQGEPERIRLWVETLTRMELDSTGTIRGLSAEEVQERARRLQAAGGSP
jgi:WD40 repeat protein